MTTHVSSGSTVDDEGDAVAQAMSGGTVSDTAAWTTISTDGGQMFSTQ